MTDHRKLPRRRYSSALKSQVLAECAQEGASVARVALSHGINANVVHKWRRLASGALPAVATPAFVPVSLPPATCAPAPDIRIELRRGATQITLSWPLAAADQCAVWMRELLR